MTSMGDFELIGRVGSGSSSTVWKAQDKVLGRDVALKELTTPSQELRGRWQAEARTLAELSSPHIVEVYGYVETDETAYLVEQWIDGATVAATLAAGGKLSTPQALSVIRGALLGLAHAHERGIVHGDVSASNILIESDGTSMLIDFGMAGPSGVAISSGTPAYASPEATSEVTSEGGLTPRSDVYSAAAVLTHLLTGVAAVPPGLSGVDESLRGVLATALALDPADRFPDASAFLAALEESAQRRYGPAWWTQAGIGALVAPAVAVLVKTGVSASAASGVTSGTATAVKVGGAVARGASRRVIFAGAGAAVVVAAIVAALLNRPDSHPAAAPPPASRSGVTTRPNATQHGISMAVANPCGLIDDGGAAATIGNAVATHQDSPSGNFYRCARIGARFHASGAVGNDTWSVSEERRFDVAVLMTPADVTYFQQNGHLTVGGSSYCPMSPIDTSAFGQYSYGAQCVSSSGHGQGIKIVKIVALLGNAYFSCSSSLPIQEAAGLDAKTVAACLAIAQRGAKK